MNIGTYYGGTITDEPDEVIEVDADIAREFIANIAKMLRRDNKRHKLSDRIAEVSDDGAFIRWLS